jgi:endonuclease YncB( thermonuclease family)
MTGARAATVLAALHCVAPAQAPMISSRDAAQHVGETVSVRGRVASVFTSGNQNVFLNFDHPYPDQTFQGVIFRAAAAAFGDLRRYEGKEVVVYGRIKRYGTKPEIVLDAPSQIRLAAPQPVARPSPTDSGPPAPVRATHACVVVAIFDGDTIGCRGLGKVRLLGIDAPEWDQQPFGESARTALASLIARGDTVRLEPDIVARDQYDRRLAYVWKGHRLVNWLLVRQGWAVRLTYPPNVQFVQWFSAAERQARAENLGLWAQSGFDCRPKEHRAHRCD